MTALLIVLISCVLICNSFVMGTIVASADKKVERDNQPPNIYIEKLNIINSPSYLSEKSDNSSKKLNRKVSPVIDADYEEVVESTALATRNVAKVLRAYRSCLTEQEKSKWSRYM